MLCARRPGGVLLPGLLRARGRLAGRRPGRRLAAAPRRGPPPRSAACRPATPRRSSGWPSRWPRSATRLAGWLAEFPPAAESDEPWLPAAPRSRRSKRWRGRSAACAPSCLASPPRSQGGDPGAFYLGRVDVTVTAAARSRRRPRCRADRVDRDRLGDDLPRTTGPSLAGALALAPGVSFVRIGSRNETAVYVRGFDMRQVPLFIDGIPVYTPYDGYADLERFTTFDVAEVRVSKGFASVLYGPNALGGAINVVSRRPAARLEGRGRRRLRQRLVPDRLRQRRLAPGPVVRARQRFLPRRRHLPARRRLPADPNQPAGDRLNASGRTGSSA